MGIWHMTSSLAVDLLTLLMLIQESTRFCNGAFPNADADIGKAFFMLYFI